MLGMNVDVIIPTAEICPPIQSMVVVTSPIGDQAPPAFAAMMIIPAKNNLMSLFGINFRMSEIITIVVVRLSNAEDKKNVTQHTIQSSCFGFLVLIRSVIN